MQLSYWERDSFIKKIDVLIVGSGLVGLTAAIHIKEQRPDWHVVVAERGVLPSGASTKNAGFTCFGSVTEILDDLSNQPIDYVMETIRMRWEGLQRLQQRVGKKNMSYKNWGSYELFRQEDEAILEQSLSQISKLNTLIEPITGIPTVFSERNDQINVFGFKGRSQMVKPRGLRHGIIINKGDDLPRRRPNPKVSRGRDVRLFK